MPRINEVVKKALSCNIYLEDAAFQIARRRKNDWVRRQIEEISKIDPIRDFDLFQSEVIRLKASPRYGKGMFELAGVGSESRYYGHLKALAEYAGIPYEESFRLQLPYVEHGIRFQRDMPPACKMRSTHCVIAQGGYLKDLISSVLPGAPQFTVGPYIHYAKPWLSEDDLVKAKKIVGRNLLVFPAHTIEEETKGFNEERLVREIASFAREGFNNIICCFYWNDVDSSLVDRVRSVGAIPVSAGMRGDCNFIRRLRSIIQISDAAAGNSLGTHIGYCLYLGVPYRWLGAKCDTPIKGSNRFLTAEGDFSRTFRGWSTKDDPRVNALFEEYWGGEHLLFTPEEMKCIFDITKDAMLLTHGKSARFPNAYQNLLEIYRSDESQLSQRKYLVLSQSLGVNENDAC